MRPGPLRRLGPLDQDILRSLLTYTGGAPSFVVRNLLSLRIKHKFVLTTRFVTYRLKVLEEHRLVRRVPTSYKTMISWAVTDTGRERGKWR